MNRILSFIFFSACSTLLSVSAQAACGGGGFRPAPEHDQVQQVSKEEKRQAERAEKLQRRQRDVDEAQAKFDNCQGDCEKERKKLREAKSKYDKAASEN